MRRPPGASIDRSTPEWPATATGGNPGSSATGTSTVVRAEAIGGRRPARAEHDEHVVTGDLGALGDRDRRLGHEHPRVGGRHPDRLDARLPVVNPTTGVCHAAPMAEAFLWGLVAASTLLAGALLAEVRTPTPRTLGLVMGFGSGVLLSAVAYELVEEAIETAGDLAEHRRRLLRRRRRVHRRRHRRLPARLRRTARTSTAQPPRPPAHDRAGGAARRHPRVGRARAHPAPDRERRRRRCSSPSSSPTCPRGSRPPSACATAAGRRPGVVALWSGIAVACALAAGLGYAPARRRVADRARLHPRLRRWCHPDDAGDVDDARGLRARRPSRWACSPCSASPWPS